MFGVDELGLDKVDRAILGRCASSSAAVRSGCRRWRSPWVEQTETVEDVYEPFLIQQGLIARTPAAEWRCRRRSPTSRLGAAAASAGHPDLFD